MNQAATLRDWKLNGHGYEKSSIDSWSTAHKRKSPRVLCFSSGKGGVGKTSVVINLAMALGKMGKKVLILDADLGLANVDVMLGLIPKYTIQHVFSGERSLEEILVTGPGGMLILPAGSGVPELANLNEGEKLLLLNEMEGLSSRIDAMLIDTAAGISENVLYFNLAAQQRIIIATPEPTSITDAYALIKVLSKRHQVKDFSILVNWADSQREAENVYKQLSMVADRFLGLLSLDFLGYIPKDSNVPKSVRYQKALLETHPGSKASRGFERLAKNILNDRCKTNVDGNIKFFWEHLLKS